MIQIKEPADCCGCTACASICTHEAIKMSPDVMGFLYPVVNTDKCVDCGLCEKVCSFNGNYDTSLNLLSPDAYAARHKDEEEVATSRSGAAFVAISDWILEQDGVVYGVGYENFFRVVHKRAITREERDAFKGSKYVQSDLGSVFSHVKQDLRNGRLVLFSGTPCQTSGLNAYVGKKLRENLFLIDIVCHGVSSPYLWRDYLIYLEKNMGEKIIGVDFRDKQRFGWSAHHETFIFAKAGKVAFKYLFYQHEMFRYSCAKCHFCNTTRPSDITIGDYWGWEKTDPYINKDDRGVSLVLVNTEKGRHVFDAVREAMYVIPAKLENCLQPNLQYPTRLHPKRMQFEREYHTRGFVYVMRHYGNIGWKSDVKILWKRLKNKLGSWINR